MKELEPGFKKVILVCVKEREGRECCSARGSNELFIELKLAVAERDPMVRVVKTQCLGHCLDGITVVIQPDNKWFGQVRSGDIASIVDMASSGFEIDLEL